MARGQSGPERLRRRRLLTSAASLCTVFGAGFLAGCASTSASNPPADRQTNEEVRAGAAGDVPPTASSGAALRQWSGRIALSVEGERPASFSSAFDLAGDVEAGQLVLFTPLGTTAARVFWGPAQARLEQGTVVRTYNSIDDLLQALTGAALPSTALFAWLQGEAARIDGWSADLSGWGRGRINAERLQPLPVARLRIVLER